MSVKHNNPTRKDYYIIQQDKYESDELEKDQYDKLALHMISNFGYQISTWSRKILEKNIHSYRCRLGSFCSSNKTKQGGISTSYLIESIRNLENTIIYSLNEGDIDCVLVFAPDDIEQLYHHNSDIDSDSDSDSDGMVSNNSVELNTINVDAFCANQIVITKSGGIFFEHFLDSIRGIYDYVELIAVAKSFYESFYFKQKYTNGRKEEIMYRTLSNPRKKPTRKLRSPEKFVYKDITIHRMKYFSEDKKKINSKKRITRKVRSI